MSEDPVVQPAALIAGGAVLLDVREPEEWEAGHVPGALFIPMGELGDRIGELPAGGEVVVMCRSGHRSAMATRALREVGITATNYEGGIIAWAARGGPVVTDAGTPGAVV
jgi:rhodanese-related sulfurtransferase